jgi:CheY-like chemotaxis protein
MKRPLVLIVEDNPNDQALMTLAIAEARSPFEYVFVPDGQDALDWLSRSGAYADRDDEARPALILLDLKLHRLSGLDVLEALGRKPQGRQVPVVVLTTSEMPSDIQRAYELGAHAFVRKPMGFPALVELVEAIQAFWLSFNVVHPALR